ncbi:hypothetical protein NDU88_005405 [Pleurodeles waltl]|uniref:Uncharacterized protein n=1 Tax=Pleurodeles waltl TaxID=8319 RepID=A0AAV7MWB6_PLEWA|nr:hypothetical protein NDU88_005405 [Pleurodeles waltl]
MGGEGVLYYELKGKDVELPSCFMTEPQSGKMAGRAQWRLGGFIQPPSPNPPGSSSCESDWLTGNAARAVRQYSNMDLADPPLVKDFVAAEYSAPSGTAPQ